MRTVGPLSSPSPVSCCPGAGRCTQHESLSRFVPLPAASVWPLWHSLAGFASRSKPKRKLHCRANNKRAWVCPGQGRFLARHPARLGCVDVARGNHYGEMIPHRSRQCDHTAVKMDLLCNAKSLVRILCDDHAAHLACQVSLGLYPDCLTTFPSPTLYIPHTPYLPRIYLVKTLVSQTFVSSSYHDQPGPLLQGALRHPSSDSSHLVTVAERLPMVTLPMVG